MHGNTIDFFVFALFMVGVVVFLVISQIQAKRRTRALIALAPSIGFTFEGDDWSDPSRAPRLQMPLFNRGHNPRFKNIMIGRSAGFDTNVFDYWFTTGAERAVTLGRKLWSPLHKKNCGSLFLNCGPKV